MTCRNDCQRPCCVRITLCLRFFSNWSMRPRHRTPCTPIFIARAAVKTTLMFCFLNGQNFWALDDVSVTDLTTNTDILSDGGFESHSWSNWSPYNSIYYGSATQEDYSGTGPRSGSWFYSDVQYTHGDGIYQYVTTVVGRNHSIEFYLANPQGGNISVAVVSISP